MQYYRSGLWRSSTPEARRWKNQFLRFVPCSIGHNVLYKLSVQTSSACFLSNPQKREQPQATALPQASIFVKNAVALAANECHRLLSRGNGFEVFNLQGIKVQNSKEAIPSLRLIQLFVSFRIRSNENFYERQLSKFKYFSKQQHLRSQLNFNNFSKFSKSESRCQLWDWKSKWWKVGKFINRA